MTSARNRSIDDELDASTGAKPDTHTLSTYPASSTSFPTTCENAELENFDKEALLEEHKERLRTSPKKRKTSVPSFSGRHGVMQRAERRGAPRPSPHSTIASPKKKIIRLTATTPLIILVTRLAPIWLTDF
ncbi:hypothetical protein V9T40_000377 [Parthenolecanium corni]|uniref:Uncharacterized protein n=1 Tax=Parthenolecanium corni TaxID=536013 RepID=A0AAN9Y1N6_9HEMI